MLNSISVATGNWDTKEPNGSLFIEFETGAEHVSTER